jgi:hypothetical protein
MFEKNFPAAIFFAPKKIHRNPHKNWPQKFFTKIFSLANMVKKNPPAISPAPGPPHRCPIHVPFRPEPILDPVVDRLAVCRVDPFADVVLVLRLDPVVAQGRVNATGGGLAADDTAIRGGCELVAGETPRIVRRV